MPDHYGTPADASTYHEARGNASWAASTDPLRLAALVRASSALDALYGSRYPGAVISAAQELLWPRTGATYRGDIVPDDVVPLPIIRAAYELALRELVAPNSVLPDVDPAKAVKRKKVKAGPAETETEFADGVGAPKQFAFVDGILADLLIAIPGGTSVTTLARF